MDKKILRELLYESDSSIYDICQSPEELIEVPWGKIIHDQRLLPLLELILPQLDYGFNLKLELIDCSIALGVIEAQKQHGSYKREVPSENLVDLNFTRIYIPISGSMLFSINNENISIDPKELLIVSNHVTCNFISLEQRQTKFLIIDFPPFEPAFDTYLSSNN
ncbi:hypothetical protein IT417_03980 [bacterium]|nr:hypothetical protein [bacterium]